MEENGEVQTTKNLDQTISLGNLVNINHSTNHNGLQTLGETPVQERSATRLLPRMPKSLLSQNNMTQNPKLKSNNSSVKTFTAYKP